MPTQDVVIKQMVPLFLASCVYCFIWKRGISKAKPRKTLQRNPQQNKRKKTNDIYHCNMAVNIERPFVTVFNCWVILLWNEMKVWIIKKKEKRDEMGVPRKWPETKRTVRADLPTPPVRMCQNSLNFLKITNHKIFNSNFLTWTHDNHFISWWGSCISHPRNREQPLTPKMEFLPICFFFFWPFFCTSFFENSFFFFEEARRKREGSEKEVFGVSWKKLDQYCPKSKCLTVKTEKLVPLF